jgi:hypothetical protein
MPPAIVWSNVKHVTSDRQVRRYPLDVTGAIPGIEGRTNENAADGLLVVQVRRLRTIYREIPEPAAHAALIALRKSTAGRALVPAGRSVSRSGTRVHPAHRRANRIEKSPP